ncbi:MAG: hypothetical protein Q9170_007547, partial [Blastenia crenularia]
VALEEGGSVWEEVVEVVEGVERLLKREMRGLEDEVDESRREEGMHRVLNAMKEARERAEEILRMVEEKGWKLFVVCIGAESEGLVEGEAVLRGVLGAEEQEAERELGRREVGNNGEKGGQGGEDVEQRNGHGPQFMDRMTEETDDDEPGPELLLSTQEDELGQLRI